MQINLSSSKLKVSVIFSLLQENNYQCDKPDGKEMKKWSNYGGTKF